MKIKGFLARISVILAIFLSQSLADSSDKIDSGNEIDSNNKIDSGKQNKKIVSAPPPFAKSANPQKSTIFGAGGFKRFK